MIFHENLSCNIKFIPYFCRKLGKVLQNLSSAAVVIGALRVKISVSILIFFLYLVLPRIAIHYHAHK